jgi:hypothetical protein
MALEVYKWDSITEVKNPLTFNPKSTKQEVFIVLMTPEMAQYILDNHNNDNRTIVRAQLAAIRKSAGNYGWMWDGGACVFTTSGNILEFQHRLHIIVERGETVRVTIVTGVDPEVFVRAAPAKNRTITDVINKKDKTATSDEVTTLRQVLKRIAGYGPQAIGCDRLEMTNAVGLWYEWRHNIRQGMLLTRDFFDGRVTNFDPWQRQFNAWATLMVKNGKEDRVQPFLSLLKSHKLKQRNTALFDGMDEFMMKYTYELSGENKAFMVHIMLCHATDKFLIDPSGNIQFGLDISKANYADMLLKGTYRDFLKNAQGLKKV